ncbi:MBL fold metallo-hydrolase [Candidatus Falkowbacteria bacterium CG11_big_fil_rev_8_21_14_0_20_39_10]|uniref:MBL fold metallo-hydrolase n=1 Tax=Candidatus Falkowbacteria bacterium CG11_big_fil_rev_8_21_14_0_20_39_10 TaxID=1974570 RepID=A0A2M6K9D3_9BACT|nr:MAG: MBL fold metallo-hydrolase [Candidatus Falkowbacteria bacterium CG11_big_fil_rev_8_21_14_0_20_39_10]
MIITYIGHSCFKIQNRADRESVTVVTDPFDKATGLKVPNFEAQIVTVSHGHHDHNNIGALRGHPFVVDSAGEYDIRGVMINGVESYHDAKEGRERGKNIILKISLDGINIVHLGDLGHVLDNKQLEKLEGTDILLIPVGGNNYTIDAKKAVEVVSQIEPRIVIPMHYKTKGSKINVDGVEKFIKEMGIKPSEEEKLKITKRDLPQEDMELVILKS